MRKLLSGLALVALVAGGAAAQPGGGNGNRGGKAERQAERGERQAERRDDRQAGRQQQHQAQRQAERQQQRQAERQQQRQAQRQAERQQQRQAERQQQRQAERQQERQAQRQVERQQQRQGQRQQERQAQRQAERQQDRRLERQAERSDRQAERMERRVERETRRLDRDGRAFDGGIDRRFSGSGGALIEGCPPGLAKKNNGCMPPGLAKQDGFGTNAASRSLAAAAGAGLLAGTLTPTWFGYDDYGPDYRYYDGYLLRTSGDNVLGYVPLLGGALAPGQPWQPYYRPAPIPAYWSDYYGLSTLDRYRYYDDVIYELNPGYSEIDRIVALLAGDPWAVGRPMPYGYDVYNVPYSYRARYYDSSDHWYRYADGYLYDVDPATRLVRAVVQLLGGSLSPGQPWLASYRPAPIPDYWTDYYHLGSVDRYRYYDDVIYELDPGYGEIDAIIAVTAGDPWTVGSRMPYGYDVYNVPYAYRTRYYDTADHWYRYSDGYIYDIDPTTRLVLAAVQLLA